MHFSTSFLASVVAFSAACVSALPQPQFVQAPPPNLISDPNTTGIPDFIRFMLLSHNSLRQWVGLPNIVYDTNIAALAGDYATHCQNDPNTDPRAEELMFGHQDPNLNRLKYTENAELTTISSWSWAFWSDWVLDGSTGQVPTTTDGHPSYANIVAPETEYFGCGWATCGDALNHYALVCIYDTPTYKPAPKPVLPTS